jgi:hypothetical protein
MTTRLAEKVDLFHPSLRTSSCHQKKADPETSHHRRQVPYTKGTTPKAPATASNQCDGEGMLKSGSCISNVVKCTSNAREQMEAMIGQGVVFFGD